jgi:hypothetical protein
MPDSPLTGSHMDELRHSQNNHLGSLILNLKCK